MDLISDQSGIPTQIGKNGDSSQDDDVALEVALSKESNVASSHKTPHQSAHTDEAISDKTNHSANHDIINGESPPDRPIRKLRDPNPTQNLRTSARTKSKIASKAKLKPKSDSKVTVKRKKRKEPDQDPVYEVEEILSVKRNKSGVPTHYHVKWAGYDKSHNSDVVASDLLGCDNLVERFMAKEAKGKRRRKH